MRAFRRLLLALIVATLAASPAFAVHARGGGTPSQAGFFPAGHWIVSPISSTVVPTFPLADSVTGATAREHQAYWDGTNDIEYDVAMGDEFGAYPYVCTLVQGPPGMTVAQSTYTTFQNENYCRVTWHPQGNISSAWNGEVEIAVTDQQHNTIDMSWALWTVGQYSTSSFSAAYSVSGSTLTITGTCIGSLTPGTVVSDAAKFPAGTYVAFDLTGTGCDGTYALSAAPGGTPSGTITGAYAGGAVFASASGSGSTCSFSVPCSLTQAFGPTFASTSYPGAIAYAESGTYSSNAASFTGTISGSTLTVSGVTGTIAVGQNISGPGNTVGAGGITEGTTIISGSGTTWTLSNSTSTASGATIYASNDLPAYTDTDTGSGENSFEAYAARKPNALIGIPGATVTLDATQNCPSTPCYSGSNNYPNLIQTGANAADWYMENITPNGYNANAFERLIVWANSQRVTFDQVVWTNGGYGTGTNNNTSMFYAAAGTVKQYFFATDWGETNAESGTPGNNYAGTVFFSTSHVLLQRGYINSPSSTFDACFYGKADASYSEYRENAVNVSSCTHAFDFGIVQFSGSYNDQSDYNLGNSVKYILVGDSPSTFSWGNVAFLRNTILSGSQVGASNGQTTHNLEGPGDGSTSGPISATSSSTSGSLISGDPYTWGITSEGVTGESAMLIGGYNGNTSSGIGGGASNRVTLTIAAGDTSAALSWIPEPGNSSQNIYRGQLLAVSTATNSGTTVTITTASPHGLSTGAVVVMSGFTPNGYNGTHSITVTGASTFTYVSTGTLGTTSVVGTYAPMQLLTNVSSTTGSYTDTGTATSATYPPLSPGNAVSAARFYYYSNAFATTNATAPPPTGATVTTTGSGISLNLVDPNTPCTSPTTTCIIQSNGQLNPSNATGAADLGLVGYQIN